MLNTGHGEASCYTKQDTLFEWVEVRFGLLVPPTVGLWIPSEKFKRFVAVGLHPWLIFGWAHFLKIEFKVPELLELNVSQIIMRSLEVHQLHISVEIPHQ